MLIVFALILLVVIFQIRLFSVMFLWELYYNHTIKFFWMLKVDWNTHTLNQWRIIPGPSNY
ncbi:hypothetical protein ASU95_03760 [Enterobacter hormaechei subsp. hoffmannii]|nr:hypothetical protein ASU95_03760 [Enterobacter hormaechei subsp. hoffmannii]